MWKENMPFQAEAVANRFVEISKAKESPITLMKLMKLVYFAHGWHLAVTEKALIKDQIEAWKFGPVAPSVYKAFKEYGSNHIAQPYRTIDIEEYKKSKTMKWVCPSVPRDEFLEAFFDKMWSVYGGMTAYQLSQLTHEEGTPWHKIWFEEGGSKRMGADIPDALIEKYFKEKLAAA